MRQQLAAGNARNAFDNSLGNAFTARRATARRRSARLARAARAALPKTSPAPAPFDVLEPRVLFADMGFSAAQSLPTAGTVTTAVVADDFNGDGYADLALADGNQAAFTVILSRGAAGGFYDRQNYDTVSPTWSITTGDFNGDGKRDVAATRAGGNAVSVWFGNGDGTFGAATQFAVGSQPKFITAGRINGDNRDDLVVVNYGSNNVTVLVATAVNSFVTQATLSAPGARGAAIGDFNHDGFNDLALAIETADSVDVYFSTGATGALGSPLRFATGTAPRFVSAADLDNDGTLDLVTGNQTDTGGISVLLGNAMTAFGAATTYDVGGHPIYGIVLADFDGDGLVDVALDAANGTNGGTANPVVLRNTGGGALGFGGRIAAVAEISTLAAGDFNNDGKLDLAAAIVSGASVAVLYGTGGGNFAAAPAYAVDRDATGVVSGDFNADGLADLATSNQYTHTVAVFLGTGGGAFADAVYYPIAAAPVSITLADFNGDGTPDLAVAANGANQVSVLLGTGLGTFLPAVGYAVGAAPASVVSGDFTGDGRVDLVVSNRTSGTVSVLAGDGNGGFTLAGTYAAGSAPGQLAAADFNGDGRLDVVAAHSADATLQMLLNTGNGAFAAPLVLPATIQASRVTAADFNGDGRPDLALTGFQISTIVVYLATGPATFAPAAFYTGARYADGAVTAADLDNDNDLDMVVANLNSGSLSVFRNLGNGTFATSPLTYAAGSRVYQVAAADVNRDGSLDLVAAGGRSVTVMLNVYSYPRVTADSYAVTEDTTLVVPLASGVLANDFGPATPAATLLVGPAHGTVTLNANGSFSYTPAANFNGTDTFTYRTDVGAGPQDATVTIVVAPVNDAPTATGDAYTVAEDEALVVGGPGVLANDHDVDGDAITPVLLSGPEQGTLTLNAVGSFTYTPAANFNGSDRFTYRVGDGTLNSAAVTVLISVTPVNDAPVAGNEAYGVDEDQALGVWAPGVLANDADIDGDGLSAVLVSGPSHGTLTFGATGGLVYTPDANFNGTDSFTYVAHDGAASSGVATVSITVNPVNDAPLAAGDAYSVTQDGTLVVEGPGLMANDSDVEGDALSAVLLEGPTRGSLTLNEDGSFTYTPAAQYYGTDTFTYLASDGSTETAATVTITVVQANQAPTTPDATAGLAVVRNPSEAQTLIHPGAASDPDGDALTLAVAAGPSHGTVYVNDNGTPGNGADDYFVYAMEAGYHGVDSFTYCVLDGRGGMAEATVTVTTFGAGLVPSVAEFGRTDLVVVGTEGADRILFAKGNNGRVRVTMGDVSLGMFPVSGWVIAYGLGGDDTIDASAIGKPVEFHGGLSNDTLTGGKGNDLLYGDEGDDVLNGGPGADVLTGGGGLDTLNGGGGNDIVVSGITTLDASTATARTARVSMSRTWSGKGTYAAKYDALTKGANAPLGAGKVRDDEGGDVLMGQGQRDVFFCNQAIDALPDRLWWYEVCAKFE